VLRRIFGPKRDEVTGGWRKLHIGYCWESKKERDHWEDQGISGWTILKWISEIAWNGMDWINLAQDRD
jgi:hypothetical protein